MPEKQLTLPEYDLLLAYYKAILQASPLYARLFLDFQAIHQKFKKMNMAEHNSQQIFNYQQLISISNDLASSLDLDTVLRKIIDAAMQLSDSSAASILLFDEEKRHLYFQVTENPQTEAEYRGIIVPEESVAGWVVENRQAVIISDVEKDTRHFDGVDQQTDFNTQSMLAVPMIIKSKMIGVLEVLNKNNGGYTEKDLEMISVLGTQAAIAVENTRLFQQSDLIAELVHEIRTPLASIMTISHLLQKENLDAVRRVEFARTVTRESQRLNELASNFLDFSRLESGRVEFKRKPCHIQELLEECLHTIRPRATEKALSVSLVCQPDLPVLNVDRNKIKQVFLNLLSNAVKYNKPQGGLTLEAKQERKHLIIKFQDSGIGIPEEEIPNLFTKFFRSGGVSHIKGTGLGLSICKRIIENHGGEIHVESVYGEGSTFTIKLPIQKEP